MLYTFISVALSTHSHIPCHFKALSKRALYNRSMHIYFFLYKNLTSWFKLYNLPEQYTLTQAVLYASPALDPPEPHIVTDVCIHNPENINN
jgi:hypothetical protein